MRDPEAVARAMSGVNSLFHVAADYRLWAPDPDEILRTNCDGTRILMQAAQKAGVQRIVYTSSVATLAIPPDGTPGDETRLAHWTRRSAPISAAKSRRKSS